MTLGDAIPLLLLAGGLSLLFGATLPTDGGGDGKAPKPEPAPKLATGATAAYPEPGAPLDPARLGTGVQRTMRLLATSTPQKRNKVRVLFYGQSITEQDWAKQVADDLRRRFPHADLEIENRAIGGFASQMLVRPAEHDVYPFYPDLVIFHVYGGNNEYEQIIKSIRSRTTAEVLMQTDHVAAKGVDPNVTKEQDAGLWWDNLMNTALLPEIARKYGCGLADVRGDWLAYLKANKLDQKALLNDGVHLNAHGCFVMARLVSRHLVYRPDGKEGDPGAIRDVAVGPWKGGRLTVPFEGNRIDLVAAGAGGAGAKVLIDGKAPSAFPELYAVTPRPQPRPWSGPLALARVDRGDTPWKREDWTLTITAVSDEGKKWSYDIAGSVTGPDGSGSNSASFTSKSGRVKIAPESFFRGFHPPLPVGTKITWSVVPLFADTYAPPREAPAPGREHATTVALGLPGGPHTLELIAADSKNPPALKAVRVYRPPVK